jgi:hypothetical protein
MDAGIGLAAGILLLILGPILYFMSRRRREPPEERQLKEAIAKLRIALCITPADGFLLTSERSRGLLAIFPTLQMKQPVFLQRSFVEAAARLSMFQEFDVQQFDAFCICLQYGTGDIKSSETSARATPAYSALCNWLLDISKTLIKPVMSSRKESGGNISFIDRNCNLSFEERFAYFQRRVCRARVWSDMGGSLFDRLKMVAKVSVCARMRIEWIRLVLDFCERDGRSSLFSFKHEIMTVSC